MPTIPEIFDAMPDRYQPGKIDKDRTYYFSLGDDKFTVTLSPESCVVVKGKSGDADVVLKTTPQLFEKMVIHGKMPGALDIARGRIKTNDPMALKDLKGYFDFGGL